jgi:regulatory protein
MRVLIPAGLWHNHGAVKRNRHKNPARPLDPEGLERLALHYVGRYATTRAKLAAYLQRKVKERGWAEGSQPSIPPLVERFAEAGYVNDAAFASARAASLQRRGYGERRVEQALRAAGIDEEDAAEARDQTSAAAWDAALRFAERKRIGPYAAEEPDRPARERAFAAMVRAGHHMDHVRRVLNCPPGEIPELDKL